MNFLRAEMLGALEAHVDLIDLLAGTLTGTFGVEKSCFTYNIFSV
jgi:hypothetical protein